MENIWLNRVIRSMWLNVVYFQLNICSRGSKWQKRSLREDVYNYIVVLLGWNSPALWIASFLWSWLHSFTLLFWRGWWHTLVSVSWVVPATAPDKLHISRKWRLLALIERISFSVAWRAHLYSVSATHDQRVQMKLSCSSATTDVVWTVQREQDELSV